MTSQGAFFDVQITDDFVNNLDDLTYAELVSVLRDNFENECHQFKKIVQSNTHLNQEIANGQANLNKLSSIKEEHLQQKLRICSELQLLEAECEQIKTELKQVSDK